MSEAIIASNGNFDEWAEQRFYNYLHRLDQVARFASYQEASTVAFGRRVEVLAADLLRGRGHGVAMTAHKTSFDLWAGGVRIECKASTWDGKRYQFNLRGSRADVYLLACCANDTVLSWFVVPSEAIQGRRNVAIWSAEPGNYSGQWAAYLAAWELADRAVSEAGPVPWQLEMELI